MIKISLEESKWGQHLSFMDPNICEYGAFVSFCLSLKEAQDIGLEGIPQYLHKKADELEKEVKRITLNVKKGCDWNSTL